MDFTPFARPHFLRLARRTDIWGAETRRIQLGVLERLLREARQTETGRRYCFAEIAADADVYSAFASRVETRDYEDIRLGRKVEIHSGHAREPAPMPLRRRRRLRGPLPAP